VSQSLTRAMKRASARAAEAPASIPTEGPSVPVSVTIIVKNNPEHLDRCLLSLRKNFTREGDEILVLDTGSTDDGATVRVARKYHARVESDPSLSVDIRPYVEKWLPERLADFERTGLAQGCLLDFGAARAKAAALARHDIQLWIDSDDELVEPAAGRLRYVADKVFSSGQRDAVFLDYEYSYAPDGHVSSVLKRERLHDRRAYQWVGRCHEVCIPRPGVRTKGGAYFQDVPSRICHRRSHDDKERAADIRNYVILRKELEDTKAAGKWIDPRTVFYLGNACRGLGRDVESIEYYTELLDRSGNRDDRFSAAYGCATILFSEKNRRPLDAMEHVWTCMKLKPEDPRGPFALQRCYFQLGRWQESLHWFRVGTTLPEPTSCLHNYSPIQIHLHPYVLAAHAFQSLKMEDDACRMVDHLIAKYPDHPDTKAITDSVGNWIAGTKLIDGVRRLVANSHPKSDVQAQEIGRRIVSVLPAIPEELEDSGLCPKEPDDARPGRPLAIWCGKAVEGFGPRTDAIGGSEKAVIQMAPRLQARGFAVTVYTNVPKDQRGIDSKTGVNWQHFGAFDRERPRGTIVYWRAPQMLELPYNAEKRILWCHDVQNPANWTPARVALVDEVWVLSEFHAKTLGEARAALGDKVRVTRNGIDAGLFRRYFGQVARDPKKVIYASSPDRGVLTAIKLFQKADVPGSTLDIFYGFNKLFMEHAAKYEYVGIPDLGRDASLWDYMQTVHTTIDKDDRIRLVGRVGWEELARRMCSAGVWLYPTRFDEISCMAAMEAQAAGLFPVCSAHAAMAETVAEHRLPATSEGLAAALTGTDDRLRRELHEQACTKFDYGALADEWAASIQR
jgi:glycosyltransferase involved in cell wall biosynthesis